MSLNLWGHTTWSLQGVDYRVDTLSHVKIGPATTQTNLVLDGPVTLKLFYTTTDFTDPDVDLRVVMGKDNLLSNVTVPDMPASHDDDQNVYFAGVNADFIGGMGPIGTTAVDGELYKSYKGDDWDAFAVTADKRLFIGSPYATFRMVSLSGGEGDAINAVNNTRASGELILYTSRKGSSTGTSADGVEVAAVQVDGPLKSSGATQIRITGSPVEGVGNMAIPENGFVLSGNGYHERILLAMKEGDILEITPTIPFDYVPVEGIEQMCGGRPLILQDNQILNTSGVLDHLSTRQPRTAVGYNGDFTKVVMMVIDGRQMGGSAGVTSMDLAAIMQCVGCTEALNFDGGGSSTLYVNEFGVLNVPSDGRNRAVKNGLFLSTPVQEDNSIAEIRFADYVKKSEEGGLYEPVIYGYNSKGLLVDTDVDGFTLQCDEALGDVQAGGQSVMIDGDGLFRLTATYNGLTASIAVWAGDYAGVAAVDAGVVRLFPNPVERGTDVRLSIDGEASVSVYDSCGKKVAESERCEGTAVLPTSGLPCGTYVVSVDSGDDGVRNLKLIIK